MLKEIFFFCTGKFKIIHYEPISSFFWGVLIQVQCCKLSSFTVNHKKLLLWNYSQLHESILQKLCILIVDYKGQTQQNMQEEKKTKMVDLKLTFTEKVACDPTIKVFLNHRFSSATIGVGHPRYRSFVSQPSLKKIGT